jgi:hypothetical protein
MELKRCGVGGGRKSIPPELEDETNLRNWRREEGDGRPPPSTFSPRLRWRNEARTAASLLFHSSLWRKRFACLSSFNHVPYDLLS